MRLPSAVAKLSSVPLGNLRSSSRRYRAAFSLRLFTGIACRRWKRFQSAPPEVLYVASFDHAREGENCFFEFSALIGRQIGMNRPD